MLAAFGGLALELVARIDVPAAGTETAPGTASRDWIEARSRPAFAAGSGDLDPLGVAQSVFLHVATGGRKERIGFGALASERPAAMIEIFRPAPETPALFEPAADLATLRPGQEGGPARDAAFGDLEPAAPPTLETKFGPMAVFDFSARGKGSERRCLAIHRAFDAPRLRIAAWYCNPGPEIVDRAILACAIDRLSLLAGGGGDRDLAALFAHAERERTFCGQKGMKIAKRRPSDWIAAQASPRFRGTLAR